MIYKNVFKKQHRRNQKKILVKKMISILNNLIYNFLNIFELFKLNVKKKI